MKLDFFTVQELVDPDTYAAYGDEAIHLFDPNLLSAIDAVRRLTKRGVKINDWIFGGHLKYCGWRPVACDVGAKLSMHRFGKAFDLHIQGMTGDEARAWLRTYRPHSAPLQAITRIELGVSWLHIDSKPTGVAKLVEFHP